MKLSTEEFLKTVDVFAEAGDCEKCPCDKGIDGPIFPCGRFVCPAIGAARELMGEEKVKELWEQRRQELKEILKEKRM